METKAWRVRVRAADGAEAETEVTCPDAASAMRAAEWGASQEGRAVRALSASAAV